MDIVEKINRRDHWDHNLSGNKSTELNKMTSAIPFVGFEVNRAIVTVLLISCSSLKLMA